MQQRTPNATARVYRAFRCERLDWQCFHRYSIPVLAGEGVADRVHRQRDAGDKLRVSLRSPSGGCDRNEA